MPRTRPEIGRAVNGRFSTGNAGRPRGALNRRASNFAHALLGAMEEKQDEILTQLTKPYEFPTLMRLAGRLLPRIEDDPEPDFDAYHDHQVDRIVARCRTALAKVEQGTAFLSSVRRALYSDPDVIDAEPEDAGR
jgi:hypothetical protein